MLIVENVKDFLDILNDLQYAALGFIQDEQVSDDPNMDIIYAMDSLCNHFADAHSVLRSVL